MIRTCLAFLIKEWRIYRSYKFAAVLNLMSILLGVFTFLFVGKLFSENMPASLSTFQGYFPYVLVGIAASNFLVSMLNGLAVSLRYERDLGTLEAILSCPISDFSALSGLLLWNLLLSLVTGALYLAIGVWLDSIPVTYGSFLYGALAFTMAGIAFLALGGIAAACILYFKRGNPIAWIISSISILLGGVYFPVDLLPLPLQQISQFLPLTLAIDALRQALLQPELTLPFRSNLIALGLYSLFLLPLAGSSLRFAFEHARRMGALGHQ